MNSSQRFFALWAIWFASEIWIAFATRTRQSKGDVRDRGSMLLLWIVITAAITASEWLSALHIAPLLGSPNWSRIAGMILLCVGVALRWAAILSLGSAFSANVAIRPDQQLKQNGLYRYVRHPSYSGLLLILVALGIQSGDWLSLSILLIPTTAALLYRISVEEAALYQAFGVRYREYSQTTRRLLPGLY